MTHHKLKTWTRPFHEVFIGNKSFEFRRDDRDFKVGDMLTLEEWDEESTEEDKRTGRK